MTNAYLDGRPVTLTEREQQIFRLIAEGFTPAYIAARLFLTTPTVNGAMLRVRDKLGARSTAHAVLVAERHHPQLLRPVITKHGTHEGAQAHISLGIRMCQECEAVDVTDGPRVRVTPFRPGIPKTRRLRPDEPVDCGTMKAVRRHQVRGDRLSELTCGCREANAEYHRNWRLRNQGKAAA